ncbi:MAG TPA: S41 family peptidase [Allosphingosinicella sp.]|jgi:hypothetical protein
MRILKQSMAAALALVAAPLAAQQAAAPAASVPAAGLDNRAVVAEIRRVVAERYVLPERRPALDAALAEALAAGRYDVAEPNLLAERINEDLARVGRDRHLNFSFDPRRAAILAARSNQKAPDPSGFERQVREANHGITELRLLPGNVRYMAYDGFLWIGPESAAALDTAIRFLGGGQAIIIDLRRNGGGDADASQYLISHFLPADQVLYTYYEKAGAQATRVSTLPAVAGGRLIGKPLYVLTSGATASAAEEFAGNVGGFKLGELVGEKTAGAGYPNDLVPIDGRFVLSVSTGRVVLASTARDWEAVGIAPTIPTAAGQALDAAQVHALRLLLAVMPEAERPRMEALAEGISARLEVRAPALALAAYAGSFGERRLVAEAGNLYYQRGDRPRSLLIPLGGNRFAFDNDPALQLEFGAGDKAAKAFTILRPGLPPQGTYERTE